MNKQKPLVVITGASAGIGAATARKFAENGYNLAICARRSDRLALVADECEKLGAEVLASELDIGEQKNRENFVKDILAKFGKVDALVNNAGMALGFANYLNAEIADIEKMFAVNVVASFEMTRLILPKMLEQKSGHLIFLGSIAAHQSYENGGGYCASKHAQRALVDSLRLEIADQPIRITSIDPGMVETEFSVVRFGGDTERAKKVYAGIKPLVAEDIAECIFWAASRPPHVNIAEIDVFPVHQVGMSKICREN
ncbi:MAG: SDR family NAD(P)-dependent oxidoreductase [Patescibacteria group bacterium]|jgi:NADP-dependent 3-hydroxy acid dehydrogenase YdfG